MTITDLITFVDAMRPNSVDLPVKLRFVNELEKKIYHMIGPAPGLFADPLEYMPREYTDEDVQQSTEIKMVPDPFSEMYRWYLASMIDVYGGQSELYANDSELFNAAWTQYAKWYIRKGFGGRCRK